MPTERIVIILPTKDCAWIADQAFQGCLREDKKFTIEVRDLAQQRINEAIALKEVPGDEYLAVLSAADAALKAKTAHRKKEGDEIQVEFKVKEPDVAKESSNSSGV